MKIERGFDEVVGLDEPFHALRSVRTRDDHLVTGPGTFAANLTPHLFTLSFEDPEHLENRIGCSPTELQRACTCFRGLSRFLLVA